MAHETRVNRPLKVINNNGYWFLGSIQIQFYEKKTFASDQFLVVKRTDYQLWKNKIQNTRKPKCKPSTHDEEIEITFNPWWREWINCDWEEAKRLSCRRKWGNTAANETNVHEETKRVGGDRAVGRRQSELERQRRWASSPNLGKEGWNWEQGHKVSDFFNFNFVLFTFILNKTKKNPLWQMMPHGMCVWFKKGVYLKLSLFMGSKFSK